MKSQRSSRAKLRLPVERLAHAGGLDLPAYQTAGAAGLDLLAAVAVNDPMTLKPGARALVPTGLRIALPQGFEAQVRPRSGLALRHGVTVLNAPGTIDADYRGEIQVLLINHGAEPFQIARGDRIAQLVLKRIEQAQLVAVTELAGTARGAGGFGSTGGVGKKTAKGNPRPIAATTATKQPTRKNNGKKGGRVASTSPTREIGSKNRAGRKA